jgi:membrane-bound lytic murein transglycosylase D
VAIQPIRVTVESEAEQPRDFTFERTFRIGRVPECDICIYSEYVSRAHVEVSQENGQWRVRDLNSSNGMFLNGGRVEAVEVNGPVTVTLGVYGPSVRFEVEQAKTPGDETIVDRYIDRYFASKGEDAGEHTMIVRKAFSRVQSRQRRKFTLVIGLLGFAILAAGGYALYLHQQVRQQVATAKELFYSIKSIDLDIAGVESMVLDANNERGAAEIRRFQERRRQTERKYDQFLSSLRVYNSKLTDQQKIILRVARIFGECELDMPPAFLSEMENYVKKWQSSPRLALAIKTAREKGYQPTIVRELLAQDLPPQFFYLALQESGFDPYISGPMTHKGIAKGMWQFIPETAVKYGLKIGPLVDFPRADPADDRHHWDVETKAAARYIKDLYTTDAQASGLLVMACYNWGEGRVLPLVRGMPANPRDRNFWRLLMDHRDQIPQQTYDYVFYIASAAAIGENPRLFGFDFDNPLAP